MSLTPGRSRDTVGRFAKEQHRESGDVLSSPRLVDMANYDAVDEAEIARQVQMMVKLARSEGVDVTEAGAWLREFDANEKNHADAA